MFSEPTIIQLSNYVKPAIVEHGLGDWVLNGHYNSYFDYIVERYNGSPTNAALIDAYVDRIYGKGLSIINAKSAPLQYIQLLSIFSKKEVRKIVADFKMFGSAVGQIRYGSGSKRKIAKIEHLDRKAVAPAKLNSKGVVDKYYVCYDWQKSQQNPPKSFPAFGTSKNAPIEIFEIKPYKAGKHYFADPDYLGGLQYAQLEEEIANFSVSHIQNGLSAGYILNFNNGVPPDEKQEEIEKRVNRKLSGSSSAGKIILNFNDSKETAPTIEAIPTNANHEQWQFWAGEARQQILVAHRVTTPMLFGVKENTGLGNNANEMKEGNKFLQQYTILPSQTEILDVFQEIVVVNGISSPLTFIPLEDIEEEKQIAKEEETPVKLSECVHDLVALGEDEEQEGWICVCTEEVDYEMEDMRDMMLQLASTGTAIPNASSSQDSEKFKIRYQYAPLSYSENSREFCKKMVEAGKVYRKEDILRMDTLPVNQGWGPEGADTYSIWLYKGGGDCHHKWLRKTYVKQGVDVDVNSPLAKMISTAEARRQGDRTRNEKEVSMKPVDMPYNGFLPTNKRFQ
jgi:hypothetical protein